MPKTNYPEGLYLEPLDLDAEMVNIETVMPYGKVVFMDASGAKISLRVGDGRLYLNGSGAGMGRLEVRPASSNSLYVGVCDD